MNNSEMQQSLLTDQHEYAFDHTVILTGLSVPVTYLRIRRMLELLLIIIALPFVLMLMAAIIIVLIAARDQKEIFFVQKRPGRNGAVFNLYKFCTMNVRPGDNGLTEKNDSRITSAGRVLRRYKLDELPQLLNVIRGEMSLIGPRPVPLTLYSVYLSKIPGYDLRHRISPGITGLAQVEYKYTTTIHEEQIKLQYDLEYIQSISFRTDLKIIFKTFIR
jgi:lipopolysaccharide/colanic/teichoic acid biosynthesis glycosyltransferase